MRLGLGLDTGGTYTDGVLYDYDTETVVARAKRRTTHEALSIGITAVLDALPGELFKDVKLAALSTTLATNACVEGKGCRTALVLMGYNPPLVARLADDYGLTQTRIIHVSGSHTQQGAVAAEPDYEGIAALARDVKDEVDAIGVVEYWGIRNAEFEKEALKVLREASGLPVAAAHELSGELNSLRRAATTCLNARLIPLTKNLMDAIRTALDARGMHVPLMIVRGDGSLMTEAFAREHPVETLLSGPAASVVGGLKLAGVEDAMAVDIGGTTTDIAIVRAGRSVLSETGVEVGGWRTGTRAIGIRTIGLGGDSRIALDTNGQLTLGPARAIPLCMLATEHPFVTDELEAMWREGNVRAYSRGEYIVPMRDASTYHLTPSQRAVIDALGGKPLSIDALSARLDTRPYFLDLGELEFLGLVMRAALTPTDLMHVTGEFSGFDRRASEIGVQLLADYYLLTPEQFIQKAMRMAGERLYNLIARYLLDRKVKQPFKDDETRRLLGLGYEEDLDEVDVQVAAKIPLIGIGAPTHVFIHDAARRLGTFAIVPPDAAVANAVGAVTGSILAEESVLIRPQYDVTGIVGYSVHSTTGYFTCETMASAQAWAREEAERLVLEAAARMGAVNPTVEWEDESSSGFTGGETPSELFLEAHITARAMGKVQLG